MGQASSRTDFDLDRIIQHRVLDSQAHSIEYEDFPCGRGSWGTVYKAKWSPLGSPPLAVAVKFVNTKECPLDEDRDKKKIAREVVVLSNTLLHKNVCTFVGVWMDDEKAKLHGQPCGLVTYWVPYDSLEYINKNPDKTTKASVIRQIAEGLRYLHSMGVIHGDLKPNNVRVEEDGTVKIVDFGLGRVERIEEFFTTIVNMRNPRYTSPEGLRDERHRSTCKSDVYCFGLTALQLLHGTDLTRDERGWRDRSVPYNHLPNGYHLYRSVTDEQVRPLVERYHEHAQPYARLFAMTWREEPQQRPSMDGVIRELKAIRRRL